MKAMMIAKAVKLTLAAACAVAVLVPAGYAVRQLAAAGERPAVNAAPESAQALKAASAVNGLRLTLSADKTELKSGDLNLRRSGLDLRRVGPDSPFGIESARLKLTFTNVSDLPIQLSASTAYPRALWDRVLVEVTGPRDGVKVSEQRWVGRNASRMETKEDYPVIEAGKSWEYPDAGELPGWLGCTKLGQGIPTLTLYQFLKPGEYRVKVTYAGGEIGKGFVRAGVAGWAGEVTSNEIMLKVLPPAKVEAPASEKAADAALKAAAGDGLLVFFKADKGRDDCAKLIEANGGELVHYFAKYNHHITGRPCLVKPKDRLIMEKGQWIKEQEDVGGKLLKLEGVISFVWTVRDGKITGGKPYFNRGFDVARHGLGISFAKGLTEEKALAFLKERGIPAAGRITPGALPECYVTPPAGKAPVVFLLELDRSEEVSGMRPNWVEN